MAVEYRAPRGEAELEEAFFCSGRAFTGDDDFFRSIARNDPWFELENTRGCYVDGKIVSVVQIFERPIRFGDCVIKMGGLGSVGTDPDYRRAGYGQGTLKDSVGYMEDRGYDLSVLFTGTASHYFRSGWVIHPTHVHNIRLLQELPKAPGGVDIDVCDPDRDLPAMREIYDAFNADRTGTLLRSEAYWVNRPKWRYQAPELLLAARKDGAVSAYLAGGKWELRELGYRAGEEHAMRTLIHRFLSQAREEDVEEIQAPIPQACAALLDGYVDTIRRREHSGAMVRIIDLVSLLSKSARVFGDRLATSGRAGWEGSIGLRYEAGSAALQFTKGEVEVSAEAGGCDTDLRLSQAQLLRLLFGNIRPAEVVFSNNLDLEDGEIGLLDILFPPGELFMWRTDGF